MSVQEPVSKKSLLVAVVVWSEVYRSGQVLDPGKQLRLHLRQQRVLV